MLENIYEKNLAYRVRVANGDYLLIGNNQSRPFNQSAYMCYRFFDGEKNVKEIVEILSELYNKDFQEIKDYLISFINDLIKQGILNKIE